MGVYSIHDPKNISVVGTPKNIGQVKYVGTLLQQLYAENKLQNTALVLGNEDLLIPILNSIPSAIEDINITMGLPLKQIPFSAFIESMVSASKRSYHSITTIRCDRCIITSVCTALISNSKSRCCSIDYYDRLNIKI